MPGWMGFSCGFSTFTNFTVDQRKRKTTGWLNLSDYTSHRDLILHPESRKKPAESPMIFTFFNILSMFHAGIIQWSIWLGWKSCWLSPGDIWQIQTWMCLIGNFYGFYHSKSSLKHHLAEYFSNFFQTSYAKPSLGASKFQQKEERAFATTISFLGQKFSQNSIPNFLEKGGWLLGSS